jgi:energy-coupling factor transport system substrate-specific component
MPPQNGFQRIMSSQKYILAEPARCSSAKVEGLVFGAESGFLVGAVAAIVSNIFLGKGPWTPWQMFAWGMMGMSAGLLRNTWWMMAMWGKLVFGFIRGYLFGWIMYLWIIFSSI